MLKTKNGGKNMEINKLENNKNLEIRNNIEIGEKQKNFIIRIWKGSVFRTILRRSSSTLKTAGSCLMMRPREKNVSSRLQRENIQNIIVDKECRNFGKDPDIQSFLSCLPFGVCAWHVWGSPVYFRREKKQNFMDRFMWSHSSNTLKT